MTKKAIVLISGGLDSTTCLAIAKHQGFDCYTLSFDYGQKHKSELIAAKKISLMLGAKMHKILQLPIGEFGGSALTDENMAVPDYQGTTTIPSTYVPARNTIFLAMALGWAEILPAYDIFIGVTAIDYSHYPDCRPEYLDCFQHLTRLATKASANGNRFQIHAPLIKLTKAEIINNGIALGIDYQLTVSCYRADEKGKACGKCDSCILRIKGFNEAGIADPTMYKDVSC
jgi:7-cyano-7-deazaguanine synthase